MAKLRLVAYRKATSAATLDTTYELDLQEHPVVSLNYQFSDIKSPETRKASYSQTFKLPFTDNNNEFFQTWFNVNLETLVFNTREKFDATLYVGTVPQFDGWIQLKSVYQKAQVYDVVLMSNTADLFSVIGENRLKDVFKNDDGSYSNELDHTYTQANIIASWNGGDDGFENEDGDPLQDADAGVQKVMYPMSIINPRFYYWSNVQHYLNMPQSYINAQGYENSSDRMVDINQLRPALQLKNMIKLILLKAGFIYRSTFIDSAYFGKLFMTTGNHLEGNMIPTTNSTAAPGIQLRVGNIDEWGVYDQNDESMPDVGVPIPEEDLITNVPANTTSGYDCIGDYLNCWNSSENSFTKVSAAQLSITVTHRPRLWRVQRVNSDVPVVIRVWLQDTSSADLTYGDTIYYNTPIDEDEINWSPSPINHWFDISEMDVGATVQIKMTLQNAKFTASTYVATINFGYGTAIQCNEGWHSRIYAWSAPYSQGIYNGTINVPACIDEDILQKDFLLDIIQRFNLVIISDPDDSATLIIEPYSDYLANGEIKHWTDKIDVSKEIIVKDTSTLMKKEILLTDLEDVDILNKATKEDFPSVNVYGHYSQSNSSNQFASGELKNDPIFSPYINNKIVKAANWDDGITELHNMAVQYEFSYNDDGDLITDQKTKPKLFYYNGSATTVKDSSDNTKQYYMHNQEEALSAITAFEFETYPLCTPFDITPSSNAYTLTSANKSLYWNANGPVVGELNIFNYNSDTTPSWFANTLYGLYWKSYLDSIYNPDARIMECHLNLDQVDIFNFQFNDEIFIKDAYWRVLEIKNYQVGAKTSTKVVMIKVIDTLIPCVDCDYVIGEDSSGDNVGSGGAYYWCPENEPDCTPDVTSDPPLGILTTEHCCTCNGGWSLSFSTLATGLYPCMAYGGSLPPNLKSILGMRSLLSEGQTKSLIYDKLIRAKKRVIVGSDNTKHSSFILPSYADDMVIKYKTTQKNVPRLEGEMHRIVATGYTEGDTRGYAYPAGTKYAIRPTVPTNSNMIIRITGTATVIGGSSGTYPVGTTEGFSWYTAFKNVNGTITQLSTAGGQQEFSIREGANPTNCTLYITTSNGELQFGLDDSQTDTKRIWSLTIDLAVQRLPNIAIPYGESWAIFQNASNIQFMNYDLMLWN